MHWLKNPKHIRLPLIERAEEIARSLSHTGRALFMLFTFLIFLSATGLLFSLNRAILVDVPLNGGTLTEGIVGTPRFINPVLAISDADRDLTSLVYAGLLRAQPDGSFVPNLAAQYEVSDDGRTYTLSLRVDATFHDGEPVTADDVLFTIAKTQDPAIKSPQRANWDGVAVEKLDDRTVVFTLRSAYSPFIENLTLGILPKHLWQNVTDDEFPFSELNTSPVGAGAYRVVSLERTASGIPSSYRLASFEHYLPGAPYLANLDLRFYQNEESLLSALRSGSVEAASGISPRAVAGLTEHRVISAPLDRVFGVFFNQNQNAAVRDATVRKALSQAIDRTALIEDVLGGYGTPTATPIPPTIAREGGTAASTTDNAAAAARNLLLAAGWKQGADGTLTKSSGSGKNATSLPLAFAISTGNVPELRAAAEYLKQAWNEMGAQVSIQIYDQGDLSQNVIRPRKYDALLFGEVVGRGLDLFAFWHSSQRNDPGLNIALYANKNVDGMLEKLRTADSKRDREELYLKFEQEISKDMPAVFLYAPDFVYVVPADIKGLDLGFVSTPSDRFLSVQHWYRETDSVWPFFASQ